MENLTEKFCGDGDRIMPGKPCENCTCGKKELFDAATSAEDKEKLETGQVESSCGKCYLGDAFRCASCPYLGKPAFEAGDKIKLVNADVEQAASVTVGSNQTQIKTQETGTTKVVLDL